MEDDLPIVSVRLRRADAVRTEAHRREELRGVAFHEPGQGPSKS
ncbi:hypothetical protein ABT075_26890 [Streptomyces sp. NPDC002677]